MIAAFREESYQGDVWRLMNNDVMAPSTDLRPALEQLFIPALVVAGRQDPCDPSMQYEIHLAVKNPSLMILERCGYFAWLEQPDALYSAIRQFLSRL